MIMVPNRGNIIFQFYIDFKMIFEKTSTFDDNPIMKNIRKHINTEFVISNKKQDYLISEQN